MSGQQDWQDVLQVQRPDPERWYRTQSKLMVAVLIPVGLIFSLAGGVVGWAIMTTMYKVWDASDAVVAANRGVGPLFGDAAGNTAPRWGQTGDTSTGR